MAEGKFFQHLSTSYLSGQVEFKTDGVGDDLKREI